MDRHSKVYDGFSGSDFRQTYFINMANNRITNGPNLLTARRFFACHTMQVNGEDFIIVAGGWGRQGSSPEGSMEYLHKANYASGWKKGKSTLSKHNYHKEMSKHLLSFVLLLCVK